MEERTEVAITTFYKMVPRFFVLEIDLALDGIRLALNYNIHAMLQQANRHQHHQAGHL